MAVRVRAEKLLTPFHFDIYWSWSGVSSGLYFSVFDVLHFRRFSFRDFSVQSSYQSSFCFLLQCPKTPRLIFLPFS